MGHLQCRKRNFSSKQKFCPEGTGKAERAGTSSCQKCWRVRPDLSFWHRSEASREHENNRTGSQRPHPKETSEDGDGGSRLRFLAAISGINLTTVFLQFCQIDTFEASLRSQLCGTSFGEVIT